MRDIVILKCVFTSLNTELKRHIGKIQIIVKTINQIKRLKKYEIKAVNSIYQY